MELSDNHVKNINDILNFALELKNILRQTAPHHSLGSEVEEQYKSLVQSLRGAVQFLEAGIFQGIPESGIENPPVESGSPAALETNLNYEQFQQIAAGTIFITLSASNKNLLKKIGVPPLNLIEVGGPLTPEDARLLKPDLPETALIGISKKIEAFWQRLSKKVADLQPHLIALVLGKDEESDKLLGTHVDDFSEKFSISTREFFIPSFKDLNWKQLTTYFE
ncbi:MAG TPA: DUF2100 domain-containing protein [Candidatus Lokiarchaeia archaeon]|nr:DUF2100 domain-containing protein [Candidatus Lokiarchaeia archaeon]